MVAAPYLGGIRIVSTKYKPTPTPLAGATASILGTHCRRQPTKCAPNQTIVVLDLAMRTLAEAELDKKNKGGQDKGKAWFNNFFPFKYLLLQWLKQGCLRNFQTIGGVMAPASTPWLCHWTPDLATKDLALATQASAADVVKARGRDRRRRRRSTPPPCASPDTGWRRHSCSGHSVELHAACIGGKLSARYHLHHQITRRGEASPPPSWRAAWPASAAARHREMREGAAARASGEGRPCRPAWGTHVGASLNFSFSTCLPRDIKIMTLS